MQIDIAQSTPTAASIARLVQAFYDLGQVVASEFLIGRFNQSYRLDFADGRRVVARLSPERFRGGPNIAFEAAALAHWADAGCAVARCLPTANGEAAIRVQLPEGPRALMLFEHLEGEATGDSVEHIALLAHGLAALHAAGESYGGPPSAYTLDLDHLLHRPLEALLRGSTMTAELRPQYEEIGRRLDDDILAFGELSRVLCHGDTHGYNNFIAADAKGQRRALFFDFDEAGPGYLAYEIAVYPWSLYPRMPDGVMSEKARSQWLAFIGAYREVRPVADVDLAAIPRFMAVRQLWLLGEYAARIPDWGSQSIPTDYLHKQTAMLRAWQTLELPL